MSSFNSRPFTLSLTTLLLIGTLALQGQTPAKSTKPTSAKATRKGATRRTTTTSVTSTTTQQPGTRVVKDPPSKAAKP